MSINMGAWVARMLLGFLLIEFGLPQPLKFESFSLQSDITKFPQVNDKPLPETKSFNSQAKPNEQTFKASSSNTFPYSLVPYSPEDSKTLGYSIYSNSYPLSQSIDHSSIAQDFSSIEVDKNNYNDKDFHDHKQFMDTTGYNQYGSQTSFNLEGPKQVEIIETKNYHKAVDPYDTEDFKKYHHKEEEENAEVHYHQHKHLHKHKHKQEHNHKHKEEHKHEHDHKHQHKAQHEHQHKQEHKHMHNSDHKHEHKSMHEHMHKQEHKHNHNHEHKHGHKQKEEHKHEQIHMHKHQTKSDHKHKHNDNHKHSHQHGHKHWNEHKHEHNNQNYHNHNHVHQKYKHYEPSYRSYYKW